MNRLREVVRGVLLEDESMLKKWALAHGTSVEKELAELDIIPLHRGEEQTSLLGSGMANEVLDVLYKGKRAVARFSHRLSELESLTDFVGFKSQLPSKYAKHFPKIYTEFAFVADEMSCYGAVVELLDPLPPGLEFDIDSISLNDNLQRSRVSALLNDHSLVEDIAEDASAIKSVQDDLISMYEQDIRSRILSFVGKPIDEFDEFLDKVVEKHGKDHKFNVAFARFEKGLLDSLRATIIPQQPVTSKARNNMARSHSSGKVREFFDFLEALSDVGMEWSDLHTGNFMVRRSTGDFVVVDPGYFNSDNNDDSGSANSGEDPEFASND